MVALTNSRDKVSIGSGNGLVPVWHQAITWTNVDQVPWCHMASLRLSRLSRDTLQKAVRIFKTLRPRQDGCHFTDDMLKCIFLNENVWIPIKISLKFVPKGPINNILALVQIIAWRRPGDKPLSEPMLVRLPTDICVTQPQWVKMWVLWTL